MSGRSPTPAGERSSSQAKPDLGGFDSAWDDIELDLDAVASDAATVSRSSPAELAPAPGLDDDLAPPGRLAGAIELDDDAPFSASLAEGANSWRPRAALSERNAAVSSRVFVNAHSRPSLGLRSVLLAMLAIVVALLLAPFMQPPLIRVAEGWTRAVPYAFHLGSALFFFVLWAIATARVLGPGPGVLFLPSLGSFVLLVTSALNAIGVISGSGDALAFRPMMPYVVPLANSLICAGFGLAALNRARQETKEPRRLAWAAVLFVLACASLLLAARLTRIDLPLWRIDMPSIPPRLW